MLSEASQSLADGKLQDALREANAAVELDPKNASSYETRGSIYIQDELWDRAERDYVTAAKLDPTISAFKYQLAEIKFLQKAYVEARPRFAAVQNDSSLGDLATYDVFLCDMLAGDDDRAARDLVGLKSENPSYYFANGAWALYHNNKIAADKWFAEASAVCDSVTSDHYMSSLIQAQRVRPEIATFVTTDGEHFDGVRVFVEASGLRISTPDQGWVTLPFSRLPDDLSPFPPELQREITENRRSRESLAVNQPLLSFTTTSGQHYDQVKWSMEEKGLRVLTPDGWITVPFNQLPGDISSFPIALQKSLVNTRGTSDSLGTTRVLSFVTKLGKHYDQVETELSPRGLRVLTSDGLITIPIEQLPDDLSAFPVEWRSQMESREGGEKDSASETTLVSFTTKTGARFDNARAFIGEKGIHLLGANGWVTVPFKQLPDDLSSFPGNWRDKLNLARVAPSARPGGGH